MDEGESDGTDAGTVQYEFFAEELILPPNEHG